MKGKGEGPDHGQENHHKRERMYLNGPEIGFESAKAAATSQHDEEVAAREEKTARLKAQREARESTAPTKGSR
jgi:hypothetical protein